MFASERPPLQRAALRVVRIRAVLQGGLLCMLLSGIIGCSPRPVLLPRVGTNPGDMSPSCARVHEVMLGGLLPLNLTAAKWQQVSLQEERMLAERLESWSQQVAPIQLDSPWATDQLREVGKLTHEVATLQTEEAAAVATHDSKRQLKVRTVLAAVTGELSQRTRDIVTGCDFPPLTNISAQVAFDALVQESGANCWCLKRARNAGLDLSGRVDALVMFGTNGNVTAVKSWDVHSRDIESLVEDIVIVAVPPAAVAWDELDDIPIQQCILANLRELSLPPPTSRVAILYSVLLGEATNATLLAPGIGTRPRRYCR